MTPTIPVPITTTFASEIFRRFARRQNAHRILTTFVLSALLVGIATLRVEGTQLSGVSNTTAYAQLDTSFNTTGYRTETFGTQESRPFAMLLQPDGKVVVAGQAGGSSSSEFGLMRFNADGSLDSSFDGDGKVTTPSLVNNGFVTSLVLQPDGKIVAGGHGAGTTDFTLVRYNADGSLDTMFGTGGKVRTPVLSGNDNLWALALRPDGRIVAAGQAHNGLNGDFAIVSYNADGTLDTTFNGNGKLTTAISSAGDVLNAVVIQPDGKIVAGGWCSGTVGQSFALLRVNTDGTLDSTFDGDGKIATEFFTGDQVISDLALQPDGKIVAAGTVAHNPTNVSGFGLVRHNTDGTLDTSFAGDGSTTTFLPLTRAVTGGEVIVRPNGQIVIGGWAIHGEGASGYNLGIARYNSNGSLDKSFDRDGRATFNFPNGRELVRDFAFDAQDRMVVLAERDQIAGGVDSFGVARITLGTPVELPTLFDQSGDREADLSVYRPSNNTWYTQSATAFSLRQFGAAGDEVVPADFDRDGITDVAVFRPSTGFWYYLASSNGTFNVIGGWGQTGDLPVVSDLTGDGRADMAVFRPSNNTWYTRTFDYIDTAIQFGSNGDTPVVGDFDADGAADIATYRPSDHTWRVRRSSGGTLTEPWGATGDIPVPADYDGDGGTDFAIYRPSTGQWYALGSSAGWIVRTWGVSTDIPVPADYDGDGSADMTVFRPSNGTWYQWRTADGITVRAFGQDGDIPIPNAFVH